MPDDFASDISRLSTTVSRLSAALERVERRQRRTKTATAVALPAAAGMDSTMGRAGRMLPTMPWNW